jgi:hypothetical protein
MKPAIDKNGPFQRLNFGAPAAERDFGLISYFVESESFRRVMENEKFILLGNRGAGKSAIFKELYKDFMFIRCFVPSSR